MPRFDIATVFIAVLVYVSFGPLELFLFICISAYTFFCHSLVGTTNSNHVLMSNSNHVFSH